MPATLSLSALAQRVVQSPGLGLFLMTLFGAFAMHVFQQYKGFTGSIGFLKAAFPGRSAVFYVRLDLCVVVLFGSVIGYVVFSPTAPLPALAAGFGWTGAMQSLIAEGSHGPS
jgi:hypothetical protein